MIGLGCDNAKVNLGDQNGIAAQLRTNYCPFLKVNGCSAHLFNLATKHAFDGLETLKLFDELMKKIYKFFSKSPKKLLDLQKWFLLKNKKYHKLLNIFDIRWLSRFDCVNNYRANLPGVLDTLLKISKDIMYPKKVRDKSRNLYDLASKYENVFLAFTLSDILGLCKRVCKVFQGDDYFVYYIKDNIQDLVKCLTDAYSQDNIRGSHYLEFKEILSQIDAGREGSFKDHIATFAKWGNAQQKDDLHKKMQEVIIGLSESIKENLQKYFPESDFINNTKVLDVKAFLKQYNPSMSIYEVGSKEVYDLADFYGTLKPFKAEYAQPLIKAQETKDEWPYFKLMLLNNFNSDDAKNKDVWRDIFLFHQESYQNILSLIKLIWLIPSNSACCERGKIIFL